MASASTGYWSGYASESQPVKKISEVELCFILYKTKKLSDSQRNILKVKALQYFKEEDRHLHERVHTLAAGQPLQLEPELLSRVGHIEKFTDIELQLFLRKKLDYVR